MPCKIKGTDRYCRMDMEWWTRSYRHGLMDMVWWTWSGGYGLMDTVKWTCSDGHDLMNMIDRHCQMDMVIWHILMDMVSWIWSDGHCRMNMVQWTWSNGYNWIEMVGWAWLNGKKVVIIDVTCQFTGSCGSLQMVAFDEAVEKPHVRWWALRSRRPFPFWHKAPGSWGDQQCWREHMTALDALHCTALDALLCTGCTALHWICRLCTIVRRRLNRYDWRSAVVCPEILRTIATPRIADIWNASTIAKRTMNDWYNHDSYNTNHSIGMDAL